MKNYERKKIKDVDIIIYLPLLIIKNFLKKEKKDSVMENKNGIMFKCAPTLICSGGFIIPRQRLIHITTNPYSSGCKVDQADPQRVMEISRN